MAEDKLEPDFPGYQPAILDVGDTFSFETWGGRRGVARVNCVDTQEFMRKNPYHLVWSDPNGKHYEWFGLQEFKCLININI
jgi:hypothetical protein